MVVRAALLLAISVAAVAAKAQDFTFLYDWKHRAAIPMATVTLATWHPVKALAFEAWGCAGLNTSDQKGALCLAGVLAVPLGHVVTFYVGPAFKQEQHSKPALLPIVGFSFLPR